MCRLLRIDEHGDASELLNRIEGHDPVGGIGAAQADVGSFRHAESSKVICDQLRSHLYVHPCVVSPAAADDHPAAVFRRLPFQEFLEGQGYIGRQILLHEP